MRERINRSLDQMSNFLASRKGFLPLVGICLILLDLVLVSLSTGWLAETNFFLHFGVIIAILGFLFAWAL